MKTWIVKTGSTFGEMMQLYGDFEDWIIRSVSPKLTEFEIVDVEREPVSVIPEGVDALIITGSHADVTDELPWFRNLSDLLEQAFQRELPMMGICFGHQFLAHYLGGRVDHHPEGGEFGITAITLTDEGRHDPLFSRLPDSFYGYVSHGQSVIELPAGAVVLATSPDEPVQAVKYRSMVYGVQFHPEFYRPVAEFYFSYHKEKRRKGLFMNPQSTSFDSRFSRVILPLFVELAGKKSVLATGSMNHQNIQN